MRQSLKIKGVEENLEGQEKKLQEIKDMESERLSVKPNIVSL